MMTREKSRDRSWSPQNNSSQETSQSLTEDGAGELDLPGEELHKDQEQNELLRVELLFYHIN